MDEEENLWRKWIFDYKNQNYKKWLRQKKIESFEEYNGNLDIQINKFKGKLETKNNIQIYFPGNVREEVCEKLEKLIKLK